MQDNCRLIVWIRLSTRPTTLWSFAGAKIGVMLFSIQNVSNFFSVKHVAWSNLIVLGTPWLYIYIYIYI